MTTTTTTASLTYLTPSDAAPKVTAERLREIVGTVPDLSAIELRPGSVVLLVLQPSPLSCAEDIERGLRATASIGDAIRAEGVNNVCVLLPHDWTLRAFEVKP